MLEISFQILKLMHRMSVVKKTKEKRQTNKIRTCNLFSKHRKVTSDMFKFIRKINTQLTVRDFYIYDFDLTPKRLPS